MKAGLLQSQRHSPVANTPCKPGWTGSRKTASPLQRRATNEDEVTSTPPVVQEVIRSPGQPLDPATRAYMESRFGHNFGNVRVHKDTKSADSARAVNAQAYTVGQQIVFGANQFSPTSPHGRELLAHELAHTIQQRNAASGPPAPDPNGVFESTADAAGRAVALGQSAFADFPVCGIGLLRQPVDPKAFNDDELAEELKRLSANLKPGDEPSWRLRALQKEAGQRGWARAEAETAARQRAERGALEAQADAALARYEQLEKKGKEQKGDKSEFTSMVLEAPGRRGGRVVRQRVKSSRKPDPELQKDPDFGKVAREQYEADKRRIDLKIEAEREIAERPYRERLLEAQRRLRDVHEEPGFLTGEQVWKEGFENGLFLESEKKAVYEDQGSAQEYAEEKIGQGRRKFESEQYQAWRAQGEQLRSPAGVVQPFVVAAAAPWWAAAAYFGTQTGEMVGDAYQACAHGTAEDCAAATAKLAAAVALARATRGKPETGVQSEKPNPPSGTEKGASPQPALAPLPEQGQALAAEGTVKASLPPPPTSPTQAITSAPPPVQNVGQNPPQGGPMRQPAGGGDRAGMTATAKTLTPHAQSTPTVEVLPRGTVPMKDFEPPEPGHYIVRKPPNAATQRQILARAGRATDGRLRDTNTGRGLNEGEAVWGHAPDYQFKDMRDMAEKLGWTQEEFDKFFEDPNRWQVEYGPTNSSRVFDRIARQRPVH